MLLDRFHAQPGPCRYLAITIAVEPMREKYLPGPGFQASHDRLEARESIPRFKSRNGIETLKFIHSIVVEFGAAPNRLARLVPDQIDRRPPQVRSRGDDFERIVPSSSGKPHKKLLDDIGGAVGRSMTDRKTHEPVTMRVVETLEPVGITPDEPVLRRQGLAFADDARFRTVFRCPVQPHDDARPATYAADALRQLRALSLPIFMGFLHTEFTRPKPDEANVLKSSTGVFSHEGLDIHAGGPDAFAPSDSFKRKLARLYAENKRTPDTTQVHSQCKFRKYGTRAEDSLLEQVPRSLAACGLDIHPGSPNNPFGRHFAST